MQEFCAVCEHQLQANSTVTCSAPGCGNRVHRRRCAFRLRTEYSGWHCTRCPSPVLPALIRHSIPLPFERCVHGCSNATTNRHPLLAYDPWFGRFALCSEGHAKTQEKERCVFCGAAAAAPAQLLQCADRLKCGKRFCAGCLHGYFGGKAAAKRAEALGDEWFCPVCIPAECREVPYQVGDHVEVAGPAGPVVGDIVALQTKQGPKKAVYTVWYPQWGLTGHHEARQIVGISQDPAYPQVPGYAPANQHAPPRRIAVLPRPRPDVSHASSSSRESSLPMSQEDEAKPPVPSKRSHRASEPSSSNPSRAAKKQKKAKVEAASDGGSEDEQTPFVVEEVLAQAYAKKKWWVLLRWEGLPRWKATWHDRDENPRLKLADVPVWDLKVCPECQRGSFNVKDGLLLECCYCHQHFHKGCAGPHHPHQGCRYCVLDEPRRPSSAPPSHQPPSKRQK
eukprot:EG_transcript_6538